MYLNILYIRAGTRTNIYYSSSSTHIFLACWTNKQINRATHPKASIKI